MNCHETMAFHSMWIFVAIILHLTSEASSCWSIHPVERISGLRNRHNHCMKIKNELITSKEIDFPQNRDVVFEFNIKLHSSVGNCMDVFAYEIPRNSYFQLKACGINTGFIALKCYFTTEEKYGDIIKTRKIRFNLHNNNWYRITLLWKKDESVLQVTALSYHSRNENVDGVFLKKSSFNYFESGGYVSFGNFPNENLENREKMTMWLNNFYISTNNAQKGNIKGSTFKYDDTDYFFDFSEGNGSVIEERSSKSKMHVISKTGQYFYWSLCPNITKSDEVNNDWITQESYSNATFAIEAEALCADLIYHDDMMTQCSGELHSETLKYFYLSCFNDCILTGDLSKAMQHFLEYASYCETNTPCASTWPVYPLCDTLPPSIVPSRCKQQLEISCYSGKLTEQGTCVCDRGWYGSSYLYVCPGGWDNPCGNVGKCDAVTGKCSCPQNYKTASNCTTCADKFTGDDCWIYIKNFNENLNHEVVASAYGYGRISMFNGISYDFQVAGYFYFVKSEFITVAIKQVSTNSPSGLLFYIEQVWIQLNNINITIALPYVDPFEDKAPTMIILMNGKQINMKTVSEQSMLFEDGSTLSKFSHSVVEIKMKKYHESNCNYFRVIKELNLLNIILTCKKLPKQDKPRDRFPFISAIGGTADVNIGIDKARSKRIGIMDIRASCDLPATKENINFINYENEGSRILIFPEGNSLRFLNDKQHLYTVICKQLGNAVTLNNDVSIEFYIKRYTDGIFFSYKSNEDDITNFDLAFKNDTILIGNDEMNHWIDTGMHAESNLSFATWRLLSINCERYTGNVWMFFVGIDNIDDIEIKSLESRLLTPNYMKVISTGRKKNGGSYWFDPKGSFILGGVSDSATANLPPFSGIIDQIRIWDRTSKIFQVRRNSLKKYHTMEPFKTLLSTEPKLTALWNFDEGKGKVIKNLNPGGPSIFIQNLTSQTRIPNLDHSLSWIQNEPTILAVEEYLDECGDSERFSVPSTTSMETPSIVIDAESKWALEVCENAVDSILKNKSCVTEVNEHQGLFLLHCVQDVIRLNSSAQTKLTKLALTNLCE